MGINIDKFAHGEEEHKRLSALFACYEQLADLCYLNRTHGICIAAGRHCDDCTLGKNLQSVRDVFGLEREQSMYNVAAQRMSDAHWNKFNTDCERNERGALREYATGIATAAEVPPTEVQTDETV